MATFETKDGARIHYNDRGKGQPVVFSHGWPLSADAFEDQLTTLLADAFALYVKTKNFHWRVSGPHFRDYHLLLDEQAEQIFALVQFPRGDLALRST